MLVYFPANPRYRELIESGMGLLVKSKHEYNKVTKSMKELDQLGRVFSLKMNEQRFELQLLDEELKIENERFSILFINENRDRYVTLHVMNEYVYFKCVYGDRRSSHRISGDKFMYKLFSSDGIVLDPSNEELTSYLGYIRMLETIIEHNS